MIMPNDTDVNGDTGRIHDATGVSEGLGGFLANLLMPGFSTALYRPSAQNFIGGLEGDAGGAANYLGAFAKSQGEIDPDTGWNSLGDWLINNGKYWNDRADDVQQQFGTLNRYQNEDILQRLTDTDYLTDSRGLMADVFNGAGSSVPFVVASSLAPEIGIGGALARGAGGLLERLGMSTAGRAVASDLVQSGANDFARYALTGGPLEAAINAGGIYDDLKNQGLSDSEIFGKMNSMIGEELPMDMLTSGLYGAVLGGNTFSRLGQGGWKRAIAANALNTPADMLGEYMQEMTQQQLQNKYSGKPYGTFWNPTEDEMQAGRAAAMGTLPMGLFGSARGARNSRRAAMAAADGGSVTGPEPVTPPAVPDPNVDPVAVAQLTGKNDDVPTADGVDVTNLDPQQYTQWYGEKLKAQGIDVPDATITVQTPKATGTTGGAKAGAGANVMDAAQDFMGQHMENGANGCVEAVTKIGARYNPFLADELSKGVVNVDTLVADAGDKVIPFDPNNLEAGDVIVYDNNDHVVLYDGNGGYVGNSSSQQKVVQGGDYNNMGGLKPTKIIKTGNGVTAQNTQERADNGSAPAADLSSLPVGDIATSIAQNTGLPANFIWAQLSHESDGGNSKLAREDHNYGGVKGTDGEYLHFDNDQQFVDYMSNYYPKYREDGIYDAQTADQFAEALQHGGYFTADLGEYEGGMHRYLEQAGLSDSGTAGTPSEKQSGGDNANTMTQQQFGDMLNEKMIDFAGTNDDTVKAVFNDMSTSKDKALVALFAPYMQDGAFANTAANREALVGNDGFKKAMSMFLSKHLSDYAPAFENGRISFQQAEDALRPRHQVQAAQAVQTPNIQTAATPQALIQMVQKGLNREQQGAILQAANTALHTPQGMANGDEAVWMNKLAKAIDEHDYPTIAQMIPNESMQALSASKQTQPSVKANEPTKNPVSSTVPANTSVQQAPEAQQANVTPLPTQEAQQSEGVRIAQPQQTVDEQNAQMDARIAEIKKQPLAQRKELGQQYLDTLRQNNVSFSEKKLAKPLMDGEPEALEHVQRTYGDLLNTITPAEAAAASQHTAPRTIQAATMARLANMVSEITSGNTYKNASPVGKLAYLAAASGHAKTVGADESVKAIDSIIADVRKKAGFSGKGTTEGMTPEQKDEFYNTFYKQSLDDATAIRKEAKDEKPANLKILDNTIEMFKQELANSKPTKKERKEVTHESTQSKNQQKPDEGAKNQDQHAKPEPRKAAGTQRKAEEGEVSDNKKAADEGGQAVVTKKEQKADIKNLDSAKVPAMGEPIHGIKGAETTVVTDSGKEIRVRYRAVPASRVITSHDAETMVPNKAYPQELQPRDRQRVSMQEQVTAMANELRPADLGAGRNLNQGTPIIRKDGVVLNGNGRAMAIQKATAAGGDKATAYRKYIFEHSKEFGLSRSSLAQLRKYMLVREVVDDIDADTMQDIIGSTAGGSRMGASEQAKADAKKIKPRDLDSYVDNEQGDLTTAANQNFVANILYRIVGKNERNAYTDEHGNVNADGIQRVKRALFSLAYNDDGLIDKMAESTDDNIRNVSRGLMSAAPAFARVNLAVKDGQAYEYDAGKTISDAVKHLDALRREGKPVKDYLNEQSMFSEYQDTDEVREVLRFFDENKRSGKRIGIFLNDMAKSILEQGSPNQTSLMDGGRATLGEIIKSAERVARDGTTAASLFDNVQEAPAEEKTKKTTDDKKDESIFGSVEDADKEMLDALGLSEEDLTDDVLTAPSGIKNTAEEREKLEKELAAELNKLSANPVFNPKIYTLGLKLAMTYVKDGINTVKKLIAKLNAKFGDKIGPWAPALAETVRTWPKGVPFDEKKVMAISKAVGARYESGITSLDDMQADMKKLLKGQHDSFAPMIEASYNGIRKFFEAQKGENDHVDDSTSGLAERAGRGSDSDRVGPDDAGGESGRRSGRGVQEVEEAVQPEGGARVRDRSAAAGGEAGNRGIQAEESGDRAGSAGSAHVSRSVRDSYEGSVGHDADRNAADIRPAQNRRDNASPAGARARAVKPNKSHKQGDLGSIKNDLPMLKPEQQEDVEFIETRVNVNNKPGVMLTNGTGTGKTYSGLGFVKRMYDAGKKNILIVSPGESINDQWIEAASKHFDLSIEKLDSTKDSGKDGGICITTYANLQANKELVNRNWDAVVSDESHTLMQNEKGGETGYLSMLRALTLNPRGAYKRFKLQHRTKEIRSLENQIEEREKKAKAILRPYKDKKKVSSADKAKVDALQKEIEDLNKEMEGIFWKMSPGTDKLMQDLKAAYPEEKRPKVLFLSATPFAHDKDVDYAEGYLFNYDDQPNTGAYNQGTPFDRFMVKHFGYRMRTNKLTRPDAEVDSRAMEVQFHDDLVNSGAMHGRQIDVDKDYDRGFILVDGGIGHKIDEGFKFLSDNHAAYGELQQALMKQFNKSQQKYLIESIKAREVIPLIQEYVKKGKKVVLFHQSMVEHKNIHPFQLKPSDGLAENAAVWAQWKAFKSARPDLVDLSLGNVPAPMETLRKELGGHAVFINGSVLKKDRAKNIEQFNDDNSGVNIIVCQQDAANAGISLHDTTGKHPRVLINIAMPERPSYAMQIEGRIYRVGNASNAVFRYLSTGTDIEKNMFASTIGGRAASVENLAVGNAARGLRESFRDLYQETMDGSWRRRLPGAEGEGTGGKEMDYAVTADLSEYDRAKSFYFAHQKRTAATKAQEGNDYFATPEPIGYKMVEWLGLKPGEKALEPSAGHGAISRWFPETTERTIVEPSGKLMPLAQMNTPGAKAVHGSFEDFNIVNKFDGIAMNPPYGTGGKTAIEHLKKAFKQLHDGGRVVAIIPEGPAADKRYSKMMEEISSEVVPIADIHLPAVAFSRAGTKIGTHIVVLDRYTGKAAHQAALDHFGGADDIDLRDIDDIKDLFDRMENMTLPERYDASNAHRVEPVPTPAVQLDEARVEGVPDETPNFTADEFEHTKTHEVKFRARPKSFLGENYRPIQKLAKAHGGYYSKFAKNSFLFEDEDERNAFLQEAEALLSDGKASAKGSAADMVKHIEFPAADTLTEREKAMQEFGQQMGVRVVFFDGPANLRGFYNKGITFINRSASKSPSWVFWHENLHWLRSNNPELYRQMVDYISGRQEFSPEQLQAYRDAIGRPELTDADTIEEMLADAMPDVHKRVDLFRKMGRENKSLIQRFFGWLRDTMAAFHNAFSQPKYGLSKTQAQAMRNALANIAEDLRDGEGRRIFRTRGADRKILTAQGEELSYPVPDDNTKYSADKRDKEPAGSPGRMRRALVKLGLSTEQLKNVELRQAKGKQLDDISGWDMLAKSVRQVARKSPAVQYIYRLGRKALDEQEHLRNFYAQEIRKFNQYVKNPKILEEVAQLLWEGDATGHAYTGDELQAMGVSVEAGRAYNLVRRVLADAYKRVNEARMQVKVRTEVIGRNDYREFIASHFLKPEDVLKAEMLRNGSMRVTYRGAKVYSKNEEVVSSEVYNRLRKDKDVYIKYADVNDDGTYTIGYTERVKPIHDLEGYMPHFFHHFMVYEKTTGDDGKEILVSLGSANSLKKATDLANQYAKANPKGQFVIRPHSFEYDEDYNNVVVGDKDYMKMMMQITKHTEMTLPEANAFLHDSVGVTKKGRHRFFGNAQHRKGAKGFDRDVQWALTHYLNASARYVAMEHFKPEAISFYERFFGDFNAEPKSNTARYIKNFINDMNGVPSYIEDELNKIVANIPFFGSRLNDAFEGRPALALSSSISWFNAVTKLGLGNFASAAINFMQFINIGTRLNSYAYANMGLKKALKPSDFDRRIIEESGVMDEVNLASDAGGYTQTRDYGRARKGLSKVKKGLDLAMIPFTKADSLMRKAAILGAYYQGVQEKGMKPEHEGEISRKAIEYAKDVNYDANFDYSTAAAPGAMRAGSVLTQQLFQFQKYPIMQFEFFWNNVVHAENNKQRARFLVPYLLMSGAVGAVPFGALINAVASSLVGAGGDDDNDLAEEIKAEMMKWAGTDPMKRRLVNTVLYGILANANINISERVGMSNAFSGEYYGNKPESSAGALLQLFGGPLVSTVYNVATQIGNHNPIETIKAVSPSLGNMLQAVVGETRTTHHRVGTVYEDMYSRVMHGLGFRSVDETNNSFVNSYLYKQQKQAQEDRKDAMDAYIRNPSSENRQRMTSLGVTDKTFKTYKENANKSSKERSQSEKKTKSKKPQTEAQKESSRLKDFTK
uniref:Chromatin remodeling complex ATPase n=1 Tax=Phage sp. ctKtV17 TaxID=2825792 RepID=A0A8S5UYD7_9VIRU|nr:MAG TPA: Chromatin remodeling complex ATPase [Phage sp. ctKtV17]